MAYDVFISYSRADLSLVESIVKDIEQKAGVKCWIDWSGIETGSQFEEVIIKAIDAVDVVIFFISEKAISSKYARMEVNYAYNTKKKVVPIVLDGGDLRGWFLFKFGAIDYIDIHQQRQYDKLIQNLRCWCNKSENLSNQDSNISIKQYNEDYIAETQSDNVVDQLEDLTTDVKKNADNPSCCKGKNYIFNLKKIVISLLSIIIFALVFYCWYSLDIETSQLSSFFRKEYPVGNPNPPQIQQPANMSNYFDSRKKLIEGLACVCKDGLWGFVNAEDEIVVPLIFEDAFAFSEGVAQVKYDGKWGFVNKKGYVVVKPIYESVSKFVEGFAGVEIKGKFGFINKSGKLVIPAIYEDIWAFSEGRAKVWLNGESFFINTDGERLR